MTIFNNLFSLIPNIKAPRVWIWPSSSIVCPVYVYSSSTSDFCYFKRSISTYNAAPSARNDV